MYCIVHPDLHLIMPKPVWVLVVVDPVAIVVEVVHVRDSVVVVVLIDCKRDINDVGIIIIKDNSSCIDCKILTEIYLKMNFDYEDKDKIEGNKMKIR